MSENPDELGALGEPAIAIASYGRRLFALILDWFAAYLIAGLILQGSADQGWLQLAVFFVEVALFTALLGGSAGQVVVGIRIMDIDTHMKIGVLPTLIRTLLICLVVPPLLTVHGRGLHDRAVRTIPTVRI